MSELDWSKTAGSNTAINGINIAEGCPPSGINNAIREGMAARASAITRRVVKSAGYTALKADHGQLIEFDSAQTLTLTAAATLLDGWMCIVRANGGDVTIDPDASETVNGATTYTVKDGASVWLFCNATAFFAIDGHSFNSLLDAGADVATAGTLDLDAATGTFVNLTGTTSVTAVTLTAGRMRFARAAAAFTLTASSSLIVNGSTSIDYTTVANDLLLFEGYGSSVVRVWVIGGGVIGQSGAVATTSGSNQAISIASGAKRARFMLSGVSSNGVANLKVQLSDASAGYKTSGYVVWHSYEASDNTEATYAGTTGWEIANGNAGYTFTGWIDFEHFGSNKWIGVMHIAETGGLGITEHGIGEVTLTDELDGIRIITTDTLDAGSIRASWEF